MRYFFTLFSFFLWSLFCTSTVRASGISDFFQNVSQSLTDSFEQTKNLSADEMSLVEHPENFSIFTPFLWNASDAGPLTGSKGLGSWVKNDFVDARWVSCYSGTKEDTSFTSAIQIVPAEGWVFQPPIIPKDTSGKITEELILKPVEYPLPSGQTKTTYYTKATLFPILAKTTAGENLSLKKEVILTACNDTTQTNCKTLTLPLTLNLIGTEHLPTPICAGIINQLQTTPVPPNEKATIEATVNQDGFIQLIFQFKENINGISIQIDNDFTFTQQKVHITGKKVFIILYPDKPLPSGTILQIKALSSAGWFDMPTQLKSGTFTVSQPEFSWLTAFKAGLLLFLFSPFYMLFFGWRVSDIQTFKEEINNIRYGIIITTVLTAIVWQLGWLPLNVFSSEPTTFFIGLVTCVALIIQPVTSVIPAFILFWFTPKPFLDEVILQTSDYYPTLVCLLWGFIFLFPFNLMRTFSASFFKFYNYVPTAAKQIGIMVRLPMIFMLGWGLFVHAIPLVVPTTDMPYHPDAIKQSIQSGKTVFLMVTDNMNITAAYNQLISGQVYPAKPLRQEGKLIFVTVGLNSKAGQELIKQLALPNRPFSILYGPMAPNGIIIDDYIPEEKWFQRMHQVNPQ